MFSSCWWCFVEYFPQCFWPSLLLVHAADAWSAWCAPGLWGCFFCKAAFQQLSLLQGRKWCMGVFFPRCRTFNFPLLKGKFFAGLDILLCSWDLSPFFFNLSKGHSMVVQSSDLLIILPNFMLSANSLQVHSLLSSVSLSKMLKPTTCSRLSKSDLAMVWERSFSSCGCIPSCPIDLCLFCLFKNPLTWPYSTEGYLIQGFCTALRDLGLLNASLTSKHQGKEGIVYPGLVYVLYQQAPSPVLE